MKNFSPVAQIAGSLDCGLLLICDHAANTVPPGYGDLGLAHENLVRHIAYDIGAAALTQRLAAAFGAPAVLSNFTRLLIDPNRGADDPTLVMRLSDGAVIPGNASVNQAEIDRRIAAFWRPYRTAIAAKLDAMTATGVVPAIVSIHSYTPVMRGVARPWQASVLWDSDPRLAHPLIEALRRNGDLIGDNEPYDGALLGDTLYDHGSMRGLPHALIEVRQDLVMDKAGQISWAEKLASALKQILADQALHRVAFFPSRAAPPHTKPYP